MSDFNCKPIYNNLELLKHTYKLQQPPNASWISMGNNFKIQKQNSIEPSIDHHSDQTWSEQFSCNPFSKTKQLFKNKMSQHSILQDDLANQHIFTAQKQQFKQINIDDQNKFLFDSFGRQDPLVDIQPLIYQYPSNASSQGIKAWNSSSIQINFQKAAKDQLILPEPMPKITVNQEIFKLTKIQDNDSSIKQFCFRLNDTTDLQATPIKKWNKKHQMTNSTNKIKNGQQKKQAIKHIIIDFMNRLENIASEDISNQFLQETKILLDSVGANERTPLAFKHYCNTNQQNNGIKTIEDSSSSTVKLYTDENQEHLKTQKRSKNQQNQTDYQKAGKFKIYQCKGRKENKTPIKNQKKNIRKEKIFKV